MCIPGELQARLGAPGNCLFHFFLSSGCYAKKGLLERRFSLPIGPPEVMEQKGLDVGGESHLIAAAIWPLGGCK